MMNKHKPIRKAVFPVGGLGTRFLPSTKAVPKEMLPVANKPLIQYAYEEAREAGIDEFIFVSGRNKDAIVNHFDCAYELEATLSEKDKNDVLAELNKWMPKPGEVVIVRQQNPLGLGHAVWCARHLIGDEPFAVLLPDEMFLAEKGLLAQMVDAYNTSGGNVIAVAEVEKENTKKYGIIQPGKQHGSTIEVKGMVEKPAPEEAPSNLSITGRYILQPEVFTHLEKGETGSGGEIQLTDAMAKMTANGEFYGYLYQGERYDCGSPKGFLEANIAYALANPEMAEDTRDVLREFSKSEGIKCAS